MTLGEILDAIGVIEEASLEHGRAGRGRSGRRRGPARGARVERAGRWRPSRREDPRRRTPRRRGRRTPASAPRGRRAARPRPRPSYAAILPDYDALVVRSQVQVDAGADRRRPAAAWSSAGPGSASTTSTSTPRPGPGSSSSTRRPATRSPPPSTRSRCSTRSPGGSPPPTRRSGAASGSAAEFTGVELRGRTLGIVGLGKIGQAIAARARAMEMTVLGSRPVRVGRAGRPPRGRARRARRRSSTRSDAVTLHVPLSRATRGLIGPQRARPDEAGRDPPQRRPRRDRRRGGARRVALTAGRLGGAGIDVFEHEPPTDSPLLDAPNTVLTPHLGASTAEAQVLRRRGGRRPDPRRARRPARTLRRQRPAAHARRRPGPSRPYLPLAEMLGRFFAQFARTGVTDADPRGRRRARRVRRRAR